MNNREKFNSWISDPLKALRKVQGSGFIALIIGVKLLNSLAKAQAVRDGKTKGSDGDFYPHKATVTQVMRFLSRETDDSDTRAIGTIGKDGGYQGSWTISMWWEILTAESWNIFEVPRKTIRIDSEFGPLPVRNENDGRWEFDPWKFVDYILEQLDSNMDLIDEGYFPLMAAYIEED